MQQNLLHQIVQAITSTENDGMTKKKNPQITISTQILQQSDFSILPTDIAMKCKANST